MFCWETLRPALHVDVTLTHTNFLSIAADHVHSFMEFLDGSGHFKQVNAPSHKERKGSGLGESSFSTFRGQVEFMPQQVRAVLVTKRGPMQ